METTPNISLTHSQTLTSGDIFVSPIDGANEIFMKAKHNNTDFVVVLTGYKTWNWLPSAFNPDQVSYHRDPIVKLNNIIFMAPMDRASYSYTHGYSPTPGYGFVFRSGLYLGVTDGRDGLLLRLTDGLILTTTPEGENEYYMFDN